MKVTGLANNATYWHERFVDSLNLKTNSQTYCWDKEFSIIIITSAMS